MIDIYPGERVAGTESPADRITAAIIEAGSENVDLTAVTVIWSLWIDCEPANRRVTLLPVKGWGLPFVVATV